MRMGQILAYRVERLNTGKNSNAVITTAESIWELVGTIEIAGRNALRVTSSEGVITLTSLDSCLRKSGKTD